MVRLGRKSKGPSYSALSSSWKRADYLLERPHFVPPETVIGQVSLDLSYDQYAPLLREIASLQMQSYAGQVLEYQDAVGDSTKTAKLSSESAEGATSIEVEPDGTLLEEDAVVDADQQSDTNVPPPPVPPLFHSVAVWDEFVREVAEETSTHFFGSNENSGGSDRKTAKGRSRGAGRGAASSSSRQVPGWKVQARAAQFERMLDERYGLLRPLITQYPQIELAVRNLQRRYALGDFSPFRRSSQLPLSRSTAIVVLFMMHRGGARLFPTVGLAFLFFVVGLQPWALVAAVSIGHSLLMRRKCRPIQPGTMSRRIPAVAPYYEYYGAALDLSNIETAGSSAAVTQTKYELLRRPVGVLLEEASSDSTTTLLDSSTCDVILLGSGPACLYTAALLTRAGRRVLVLVPDMTDASGCLTLNQQATGASVQDKFKDVPFDAYSASNNIANLSKQVKFLIPALSTTTDYQGGVRFARIGTAGDGYAYEILAIPGMGADRKTSTVPFVLRSGGGGARAIMEDAATFLGDGWPESDVSPGQSSMGAYLQACEAINASSGAFFLSKILSESASSLLLGKDSSAYEECARRSASGFLEKCFPLNAHARSLAAGIGMRCENLRPSQTSMAAHVSASCAAATEEGIHYPVGGPRALCRAFASVIEQGGGQIVTGVHLKELLFDEDPTPVVRPNASKPKEGPRPPRCVGVQLSDGRSVRFHSERYKRKENAIPAVVSMQGFVDTFIRLLPENIRTKYKVPVGLPALSERRPVFKVLYAISGSASDLEVTGADYFRLPNASLAMDVFDSSTGSVICGEIGGTDDSEDSNAERNERQPEAIIASMNKSPEELDVTTTRTTSASKRKQKGHKVKYHPGDSWLHISFPSAKDPSFPSRHGNITTCVVTIEADNDFVTPFDTSPKLFVINKETAGTTQEKQRLLDKVTKDLVDVFPQLDGKIDHAEVRGPYRRGLSHSPERFAAKGVRADTPYPGLFVGGSDLTVGDSFGSAALGGWLVANAVVGYNAVDHLVLQKNITTDLAEFMVPPALPDDEDLAVPYTVNSQPVAEASVES
jgi:phytoene dehydrogenase-like protein